MSEQHNTDWLKQSKIFIWQGGWNGGAETVMFEMAKFLHDTYQITPTLGVFKENVDEQKPFPQITIETPFPKLVAYKNLIASWKLRKQLQTFDLVITHSGGFWKTKQNHFAYHEPGDLFRLFAALPLKSKIGYTIPLLFSIYGLRTADLPIAASKKAEHFFDQVGVKSFLSSSNFIDISQLPNSIQHTHDSSQPFQLVFIGRDDKIKNLPWLERTCTRIAKTSNIHLHVFGIKKPDTEHITYHGWVQEKTIFDFLTHRAHAFILASLFEASPLVLLQALACGTPSLVKTSALPTELTSFVSSFEDETTLEQKITMLITTYTRASEIAAKNASIIRRTYDKQFILKREFEAIASRILATHLESQKIPPENL
jgi:glycosyltransferase involved in cell wall biosynthesis